MKPPVIPIVHNLRLSNHLFSYIGIVQQLLHERYGSQVLGKKALLDSSVYAQCILHIDIFAQKFRYFEGTEN